MFNSVSSRIKKIGDLDTKLQILLQYHADNVAMLNNNNATNVNSYNANEGAIVEHITELRKKHGRRFNESKQCKKCDDIEKEIKDLQNSIKVKLEKIVSLKDDYLSSYDATLEKEVLHLTQEIKTQYLKQFRI
ncbi:MAG: hypothetical protein ACRCZ9_06235 [Fusobacteriaceae bacterium]